MGNSLQSKLKGRSSRLLSVCILLSLVAGAVWWFSPKPPLFDWATYSTAWYDKQGELLQLTLADDDRYRLYTPLKDISQSLQKSTLIYEDRYFYQHIGINPRALIRAFVTTYILGNRRMGASTISMQVARLNFHLDTRSLFGKLKQMLAALWLERHYNKDEILTAYLNHVPYGGNIEGIGAASLMYFHKPASQLSMPEALALAVVPQNPVGRNPQRVKGYQKMMEARGRLLGQWTALAKDKSTVEKAWFTLPLTLYKPSQLPFYAPHFVRYLNHKHPWKRGGIVTSLDLSLQKKVKQQVSHWLQEKKQEGLRNASILIINHKTHAVESWLGSADFYNVAIQGQVDGILAKRSPGSALKPFVYALALQQGLIHPHSLLKDLPHRFGGYTPENFDRAWSGPIDATQALITSRNIPAVRLTEQLHSPDLYHWLKQAKISAMRPESIYGLSLALGGMEVSPMELGKLYAMLANGGTDYPLIFSKEARSSSAAQKGTTLLTPESAWLTENMLSKNPAPNVNLINMGETKTVAWKTGTSFAFRDAWSVGISGDYVVVVWVGNFNGEGNPSLVGRHAAGPLLFRIIDQLPSPKIDTENVFDPDQPPFNLNLRKVDICQPTGALPGKYCPQTRKGWFIPGVSPIRTANVYRAIPVYLASGKRACQHQPGITQLNVFEFWPSDITRLYRMAGLQKQTPPPFESRCTEGQFTQTTSPPVIESPTRHLIYQYQGSKADHRIPFRAVLDAGANVAYWFVDKAFVGKTKKGETLFWASRPGVHEVSVVDDQSQVDSLRLKVALISRSY